MAGMSPKQPPGRSDVNDAYADKAALGGMPPLRPRAAFHIELRLLRRKPSFWTLAI